MLNKLPLNLLRETIQMLGRFKNSHLNYQKVFSFAKTIVPASLARLSTYPLYKKAVYVRFAILCILLLAFQLFRMPQWYSFRELGFGDAGAFINIDRLIDHGLRPTIDFGYYYGLLPIAVQRVWYYLFGRTPVAYAVLVTAYTISMAWAWTRFNRAINAPWLTFFFLLFLLPFLAYPGFSSFAHSLMQLLMLHSVVSLLEGQMASALLLASLSWLDMPSLPLLLTLGISAVIVITWWRCPDRSLADLFKKLMPAATTWSLAIVLFCKFFGLNATVSTILPTRGAAHYKAMNYGFFGMGRYFWNPPGANWKFYVGGPSAIWIFSTVLISLFVCIALWRVFIKRTEPLNRIHYTLFVCFFVHLAFILFAFGHGWTTAYYFPILVAGLLLGLTFFCPPATARILMAYVAVLSLLSQKAEATATLREWKTDIHASECGKLFCSPELYAEWKPVLSSAVCQRVFVFGYGGGIDSYFPNIQTPQTWMLLLKITLPREQQELLRSIATSDNVVLVKPYGDVGLVFFKNDKELQRELAKLQPKFSGKYVSVWERRSPKSTLTDNSCPLH